MLILDARDIKKSFSNYGVTTEVLKGANLKLEQSEICALVGPSGCGKTTLLHICGLLESADSGVLRLVGEDCSVYDDRRATMMRNRAIGFIYQFHHLLPEFSVIENVMMPLLIAGVKRTIARKKAEDLLKELGIGEKIESAPAELSGGQQQRVAIARALVHEPRLVLADEPTGNLDEENAGMVFEQMVKIAKERQVGILMVTHNLELAKKADRILTMVNGIVEQERNGITRDESKPEATRRRGSRNKSAA